MTKHPGLARYCTLLLLCVGAPAAALPPPVPVGVTVIDLETDLHLQASTERAVALLLESGFVSAGSAPVAAEQLDHCRSQPSDVAQCVSRILSTADAGEQVALLVDHPQWRSAAIRVRCIGRDYGRAKETSIHLRDVFSPHGAIWVGERAQLAGCLIGALHGPSRPPAEGN
jgi:hypothetical protein